MSYEPIDRLMSFLIAKRAGARVVKEKVRTSVNIDRWGSEGQSWRSLLHNIIFGLFELKSLLIVDFHCQLTI